MEKAAAIIYTDGSARISDDFSNAAAEILFQPVAKRVNQALDEAGIVKRLYLFHNGEEDLFSYAQGYDKAVAGEKVPYLEAADYIKADKETDYFVVSLDAVFTKGSDVKGSYDSFKKNDEKMLVIASGNRSAFMTEMGISSFWAKGTFLSDLFDKIDEDVTNTTKFITTAFKVLSDDGKTAGTFIAGRNEVNMRVNSLEGIVNVNAAARTSVIKKLIKNGVNFIATDGIIISEEAVVGKGTTILPGTIIKGYSAIGENCEIGPNSFIDNAVIGNDCTVRYSEVKNTEIKGNEKIGPFNIIG